MPLKEHKRQKAKKERKKKDKEKNIFYFFHSHGWLTCPLKFIHKTQNGMWHKEITHAQRECRPVQ